MVSLPSFKSSSIQDIVHFPNDGPIKSKKDNSVVLVWVWSLCSSYNSDSFTVDCLLINVNCTFLALWNRNVLLGIPLYFAPAFRKQDGFVNVPAVERTKDIWFWRWRRPNTIWEQPKCQYKVFKTVVHKPMMDFTLMSTSLTTMNLEVTSWIFVFLRKNVLTWEPFQFSCSVDFFQLCCHIPRHQWVTWFLDVIIIKENNVWNLVINDTSFNIHPLGCHYKIYFD